MCIRDRRFSVAVLGTLSILMLGRAARRLFASSYLGTCAALLLAFDGHHFTHSRTGLLDLIAVSYTHLDVYKRQTPPTPPMSIPRPPCAFIMVCAPTWGARQPATSDIG